MYHKEGNYNIDDLSIDILSIVGRYVYSTRKIKVRNIDIVKDIIKKLDTVDKLRNINALLYNLSQEEYEDEMNNILDLFIEDMEYENIFVDIKVEMQTPAENLT